METDRIRRLPEASPTLKIPRTNHSYLATMNQPVIGISPDCNDLSTGIESHYFVRRNYASAIAESGGIPIVLPYRLELVECLLDLVDGIMLTGGMFDIDPALYGASARYPEKMALKADRTRFEQALLRGALARDMPVLGICGGMQLIAVEMGATLVQHIPSEIAQAVEHKQHAPCDAASHRIRITRGSRLHAILGIDSCEVNSLHHQAVQSCDARLQAGAVADDGVIEAIEVADRRFCIGVQWHPEYLINPQERNLFGELVAAAAKRR